MKNYRLVVATVTRSIVASGESKVWVTLSLSKEGYSFQDWRTTSTGGGGAMSKNRVVEKLNKRQLLAVREKVSEGKSTGTHLENIFSAMRCNEMNKSAPHQNPHIHCIYIHDKCLCNIGAITIFCLGNSYTYVRLKISMGHRNILLNSNPLSFFREIQCRI